MSFIRRTFFFLSTCMIACFSLLTSVTAKETPPVLQIQSLQKQTNRYQINLFFLEGFKLNEKVPESKRLTYTLEEGTSHTFTTTDFKTNSTGATLKFKSSHPPHGTLTVYLCRYDLCQRVVTRISSFSE